MDDGGVHAGEPEVPDFSILTPTQIKVLRCVCSGLSNRQIAQELGIAEGTVKVHISALMRRLKVRNRTQVAIVGSRIGSADRRHRFEAREGISSAIEQADGTP
ncbi:helix-turn-helix domain-containing protein [Novosphingobium kaempferiae]|uniref:helix-turn-helix domain-containing protein n=1 Tax=Novosphingobium kaempferiae TaxID=2896849 RepID=UPI001E5C1E79|nr:response regulator transcription factor [Novosphingobium kaempferiae]